MNFKTFLILLALAFLAALFFYGFAPDPLPDGENDGSGHGGPGVGGW